VEAIGPLKAVKALDRPVAEIAAAIENNDLNLLKQLKGIGARTAQKIIATLSGKMAGFVGDKAAPTEPAADTPADAVDGRIIDEVMTVLISQLGYRQAEARRLVAAALEDRPEISSAEALLDAVLRSGR
jgi:Holliday junction DNA helicase RuvA